jgi:hypothetical protein
MHRIFSSTALVAAMVVLPACRASAEAPPWGDEPGAIRVPYGCFLLVKGPGAVVALKFDEPKESGLDKAKYEWYCQTDGSGNFTRANITHGSNEVFEKYSSTGSQAEDIGSNLTVRCGPFQMVWSAGTNDSGWIYWPKAGRIEIAVTPWRTIGEVDVRDTTLQWKSKPSNAYTAPFSLAQRFVFWLSPAYLAILLAAAFLHWQRTRHWSLLALATGSLLLALGAISTLALLRGWLGALGAPYWFVTNLVNISPWLTASAQVIAAVGGIGAIHWAIGLRKRHTALATNTGQPQVPASQDQPSADG